MAKNGRSKGASVAGANALVPAQGMLQNVEVKDIPSVNPNNVQSVYTNSVAIMNGQFDIRMLFNEIVLEGLGKPVQAVLRANVTMTPAHAKAFVEALTTALEQYPTTFGEIPWPPKKQG